MGKIANQHSANTLNSRKPFRNSTWKAFCTKECQLLGSRSSQNRVTDFWFDFFFFWVTLLGATRSETSGGTPRDLLETRCGALQVLSWRFTEDFGCKFDADFVVQSFCRRVFSATCGADFSNGCSIFGFDFWVRFFAEGAKLQNRAFLKKSNPKFEPKIRTPSPTPG